MLLKDNIHWGEKVKKYEDLAISRSIKNSDAILIVRAVSRSEPSNKKSKQEVEHDEAPEIVLGGKNPNAGKIKSIHTVEVLQVVKGIHQVGQTININVLEPKNFDGGGGCGEPTFDYVNVNPMENTFKYLVYLNGSNVLRQNKFVEWHKDITAEEELERLKK
ncbi:hypothetical protein GCM10011613_33950 [Cellvibrio zantedeschiae]|uniref:Uncharacterized protein n=2 Tax=Cellvibrio zantedeschiae TaxID=1237077 RepID=A0ABQ3BA76_9GAMM|nr:hypothetical protein GCM10011613_33950 [Cellvibrio zantedeschiae]